MPGKDSPAPQQEGTAHNFLGMVSHVGGQSAGLVVQGN